MAIRGTNQLRTNVAIMLVMTQVSKKVPFEDPFVLNLIRALYVLSNVIMFGIYMFMKSKIDSKKVAQTVTPEDVA